MLARGEGSAEIGKADARKRSGKNQILKKMDKFKELSFEEMQETNGGLAWGGLLLGIMKFAVEVVVGGALLEIATDGWDQCMADYQAGYNEARAN